MVHVNQRRKQHPTSANFGTFRKLSQPLVRLPDYLRCARSGRGSLISSQARKFNHHKVSQLPPGHLDPDCVDALSHS